MEAGLIGIAISDWPAGFITSAKNFPSLTGFGAIEFCVGVDFFDIVRVFGTSSPVRDVILAAIDEFNFFPFVFLNGTLSIMIVSSAFFAAGEEITSFRGM